MTVAGNFCLMPSIPKKVIERLSAGLKKFQPILSTAKARDDGEADTVMIRYRHASRSLWIR
jgi:hypothetical protein